MSPIALRPAEAADAAAVARVLPESRRVLMPFLADYASPCHTLAETHAWMQCMQIPARGVTVATWADTSDAPIGVLASARRDGCSWIGQLYVHPEHVGRSAGRAMLTYALATLTRPVQLHTLQPNTRDRGFHERRGFRAVALGDGQDTEERCPGVLYRLDGATPALC